MSRVATPWAWSFPAIDGGKLGLAGQLSRVVGEADEALMAFVDGESDGRIAEELLDTVHAAETALRMLERAGVDMGSARDAVVEKNRIRGYYGQEES